MSSLVSRRDFFMGTGACCVLGACDGVPQSDIHVALAGSANSDMNGVWVWVSAFVEHLRGAGLSVDVSFNSAVGGEADRTELTSLGLLHVNDSNSSELSIYSPAYIAMDLPFLFDGLAHFEKYLENEDFRSWLSSDLQIADLVFADVALLGGMSGLFTSDKPVYEVNDLTGLRLRAMGQRDLILIEALGASGVQVAWEEVPQALQTGIADGYFNPPLAPVLFGHGSQLNYFTDLKLSVSQRPIVLSKRWLESLPPNARRSVGEAIDKARTANRLWAEQGQQREVEALSGIGVNVIQLSPQERQKFLSLALPIYGSMGPTDAIDRVLKIAEGEGDEI